jgi:hypothetical protein
MAELRTDSEEMKLVERLRERASFMREAGHHDDADIDEEAADTIARIVAERDEARKAREAADQALVDKYRDPKTGVFSFPTDVAKIVVRLDAAEASLAQMREALTNARAYVLLAVSDDGGIDNCEVGDRLALERIDAALQGAKP